MVPNGWYQIRRVQHRRDNNVLTLFLIGCVVIYLLKIILFAK
jgi:hypothetical protein